MSNWHELDLSIYHKKLELTKLDSFIKNKPLKIQIKTLNEILFDILETRRKKSQKDFHTSYDIIIKEIQSRIKQLKTIRNCKIKTFNDQKCDCPKTLEGKVIHNNIQCDLTECLTD